MLLENYPRGGPFVATMCGALSGGIFGTLLSRWDQEHWDVSKAYLYGPLVGISLVAVTVCSLWAVKLGERNKAGQTSTAQDETVTALLQSVAAAFGSKRLKAGELYIRANVMKTIGNDKVGRRRKVDAETAFNMDGDADRLLELRYDEGASGAAANSSKELMLVDLGLTLPLGAPAAWALDPKNRDIVRTSLKTVISIAIPDPDNPKGPVLGTLQVDSDNTLTDVLTHLLGVSSTELVSDPATLDRARANVLGIMEPMARALSRILAVG